MLLSDLSSQFKITKEYLSYKCELKILTKIIHFHYVSVTCYIKKEIFLEFFKIFYVIYILNLQFKIS